MSKVHTLKKFLSEVECRQFIDVLEAHGFNQQFAKDGRLIRHHCQLQSDDWAKLIYDRLKDSIPQLHDLCDEKLKPDPEPVFDLSSYQPCQVNERFRCYKYSAEQEFRKHVDFSHEYHERKRTFCTVLIYLNDDFTGGSTDFETVTIHPQVGDLVFFPHELFHHGMPIVSGVKYTLRTDIVYSVEP